MKTIITHSSEETQNLAHEIVSSLHGKNILALYGDLGSGKTTFSQGIGKTLGVTRRMISPTFVLVREYDLPFTIGDVPFSMLYHIDLYRIGKPEEVVNLGILDYMNDPKNLVVIEWAEKMGKYLPENRVDIKFEYVDEEKRKIAIDYC